MVLNKSILRSFASSFIDRELIYERSVVKFESRMPLNSNDFCGCRVQADMSVYLSSVGRRS